MDEGVVGGDSDVGSSPFDLVGNCLVAFYSIQLHYVMHYITMLIKQLNTRN